MAKNEASKKHLGVTLKGSKSFLSINCMRLNHAYASGLDMLHTEESLGDVLRACLTFFYSDP